MAPYLWVTGGRTAGSGSRPRVDGLNLATSGGPVKQLVQPVLSILWAALIPREHLAWATVVGGLAVVLCARSAVRTRLSGKAG